MTCGLQLHLLNLREYGDMKVSVIGLGYVGCVSAACLATTGHDIVGVDINPVKIGRAGWRKRVHC